MRTTIIYDNTAIREDLKPNWGFSALVEAGGKKILFDTGGSGKILLGNMAALGINPRDIEDVFISHAHYDHTGGLSAFLDLNSDVKVWLPPSFRGVKNAREHIVVDKPAPLYAGIYSTGELEQIEQSLCVRTEEGVVIVAGCSHPRMDRIIAAASEYGPVYGIIGGLHGNGPAFLKDLGLICPTHCSQHKQEIRSLYPDSYVPGGAGKVIDIKS